MLGIDEVGRGPLAGPVTICLFYAPKSLDLLSLFEDRKLKDSKKLSKKKREEIYRSLQELRQKNKVDWVVLSRSAKDIDKLGISKCIYKSIQKGLNNFPNVKKKDIKLDGALPKEFGEIIIKGDEKVPVIALASIVAKVTRDRYMKSLDKKVPGYGFAQHAGYGSAAHRAAVRSLGPSKYHRITYLGRTLQKS